MTDSMLRALLLLLLTGGLALTGCGDDDGDDASSDQDGSVDEHEGNDAGDHDAESDEGELELPEVDCDGADVPSYDEVAAFDTCVGCHSSEVSGAARQSAPEEYNFDSYDGAADEAEEIAHEVYEGEMPPEGSGLSLTDDEKEELYLWALCGAPE